MDELRWILLIIGAVVVAGIYGYGQWQERRHRPRTHRGRREPVADPDIADALRDIEDTLHNRDPLAEKRADAGHEPAVESAAEDGLREPPPVLDEVVVPKRERPAAAEQPAGQAARGERKSILPGRRKDKAAPVAEQQAAAEDDSPAEKVVALCVMAQDADIRGDSLRLALEGLNLRYGEHGIFHRLVNTGKGPVALFSAANIVEPGWFDLATMDELRTPGVALFMQLPGPADGLVAFEEMHDAAKRIAEQVGGKVLDGRRCALTGQALEAIREDLREYRRKQHLQSRRQG